MRGTRTARIDAHLMGARQDRKGHSWAAERTYASATSPCLVSDMTDDRGKRGQKVFWYFWIIAHAHSEAELK